MSFIEEIREIKKERLTNENDVINEIVEYFRKQLESKEYEDRLKKRIIDKINDGETHYTINIEFHSYCPGCGNTYFRLMPCSRFELENGKYDYKGIELRKIQEKVCLKLVELTTDKMKELGLEIGEPIRNDNRFGEIKIDLVVKW